MRMLAFGVILGSLVTLWGMGCGSVPPELEKLDGGGVGVKLSQLKALDITVDCGKAKLTTGAAPNYVAIKLSGINSSQVYGAIYMEPSGKIIPATLLDKSGTLYFVCSGELRQTKGSATLKMTIK